jgi:uncharacterized membrane protein YhaH (DUF805 family)
MNWYLTVLKKYATFSGRARRTEFWMFTLFSIIISLLLQILDYLLKLEINEKNGVLGSIYSLFIFLPSLAASVRRLQDTNRSGWFLLLWFLPIIGWIWLLVLHVIEGDSGSNEYGNDPKSEGNDINNDDTLDSHMV